MEEREVKKKRKGAKKSEKQTKKRKKENKEKNLQIFLNFMFFLFLLRFQSNRSMLDSPFWGGSVFFVFLRFFFSFNRFVGKKTNLRKIWKGRFLSEGMFQSGVLVELLKKRGKIQF